jgi:myo-inositol-1(or 4)-monophosphatase
LEILRKTRRLSYRGTKELMVSLTDNTTTPPETAKFFETAWQAVHAAGALIRDNWQRPKEISYKGDIDLVTSVDRDAERCIVDLLQRNFPGHSILAEEETDFAGSQDDYQWIIDPLDGTTNFAHGYPQFCVSIALEHEHDLLLGLVYDPLRRECFSAIRGQGAKLNGQSIRVSAMTELDGALLSTGFPYDRRDHADFYLTFFKAFLTRCQGIRRGGAAALDLCYVACGRLDGFWELKLKPWDTAAGSLIVQESGGHMSDFSGGDFSIHGSETMASNGAIHPAMVDVMREIQSRSAS